MFEISEFHHFVSIKSLTCTLNTACKLLSITGLPIEIYKILVNAWYMAKEAD